MNPAAESLVIYHTSFCSDPKELGITTITDPFNGAPAPPLGEKWAERAFLLTNHPSPPTFQSATTGRCPSLSVGDIVSAVDSAGNNQWFLCLPCGWYRLALNAERAQAIVSGHNARWEAEHEKLLAEGAPHCRGSRYWSDLAYSLAKSINQH